MYLPQPNEGSFELAPAGTHMAVCYRVIDLGTQQTTFNGQAKTAHKILISWELPDEKMEDGRPFTVSNRYTWSMSEKATLRKHLESWRGVPFQERDFGPQGFNIKNILGKACLLTITHTESGDRQYANIAAVSKLMRGMQPPQPTNPLTYLWLHRDYWSEEVFHTLGHGLQGVIMKAPEYKALYEGQQASRDDTFPGDMPSDDEFAADFGRYEPAL